MNIDAKVGSKPSKNDRRDVRCWVGSLTLKATREGDQHVLSAIYKVLSGQGPKKLLNELLDASQICYRKYQKLNSTQKNKKSLPKIKK